MRVLVNFKRNAPDNTHLSQRHPLDVVLVRLQRPKDSPFFAFLYSGQVLDVAMSALSSSKCCAPHNPWYSIFPYIKNS